MPAEFDVFLSHNSRDKPVIERIGTWLKGSGLRVWFDRWELRPGFPWQEGLEDGMAASKAGAVFVGADGLGDWQTPEMRVFVARSRREKVPVIPVLLPGCPDSPKLTPFLEAFTWIDLRQGVTEEGLQALLWGITGVKPRVAEPEALSFLSAASFRPIFLHNLPYPSLGPLFQGREAALARLREGFTRTGRQGPAIAIQAIHGLGGVGKSRLAVEYAWRQAGSYSAAFYALAGSAADLRRDLAALCGPTLLNLPEQEEAEEEVRFAAAVRALGRTPGWLLVLDSLDAPEATAPVNDLLSRLLGGHVLLVGRISRWSAEVELHAVQALEERAAVDFLLARTRGRRRGAPQEEAQAAEIAAELGTLPLALEQAGAYIAVRGLTFAEYLDDWRTQRRKVLAWFDPAVSRYPASVAVTWQTSVDRLSELGRMLLRILSWFGPEPIPEFLFTLPVETPPDYDGPAPMEILLELESFSLVTRSREAAAFSVHRLVQELTRRGQDESTRDEALTEGLSWIDEAFGGEARDARKWPSLEQLVPHARALIGFAEGAGIGSPAARLMVQLGVLFQESNRLAEAEPLLRRGLAIFEGAPEPEPGNVAAALNELAILLQFTHRLEEAEALLRRAIAIRESAASLHNLAKLLTTSHRTAEAEAVLQRALALTEAAPEPDPSALTSVLTSLSALLKTMHRLEESERLARRSLAICETTFGGDHPRVALRLSDLAVLLLHTHRMVEGEPLLRRALAIEERLYGPDHTRVAAVLANLALTLQATSRSSGAEPLMRRALAIREASFGPVHPEVAESLSHLGMLYQASNRQRDAEPLLRRALGIAEASFGPEHPNVAAHLANLAQLLFTTQRPADAEPLLRRSMAIQEKSLGPNHPDLATALNNLAVLLQTTDRTREAEPLLRRALAIDEKSLGPEHPDVGRDLHNLAVLCVATNRPAEAASHLRRALEIYRDFARRTGHEHPNQRQVEAQHAALGKTVSPPSWWERFRWGL